MYTDSNSQKSSNVSIINVLLYTKNDDRRYTSIWILPLHDQCGQ